MLLTKSIPSIAPLGQDLSTTSVNKPFRQGGTMAQYKYGEYLHQSNHEEFDKTYAPGTIAANSGIYRCTNCGDEEACNKGNPLEAARTGSD